MGTIRIFPQKLAPSATVTVRFARPDGLCACKVPTMTLHTGSTGAFQQSVPGLGYFEVCATATGRGRSCETVHAPP